MTGILSEVPSAKIGFFALTFLLMCLREREVVYHGARVKQESWKKTVLSFCLVGLGDQAQVRIEISRFGGKHLYTG